MSKQVSSLVAVVLGAILAAAPAGSQGEEVDPWALPPEQHSLAMQKSRQKKLRQSNQQQSPKKRRRTISNVLDHNPLLATRSTSLAGGYVIPPEFAIIKLSDLDHGK